MRKLRFRTVGQAAPSYREFKSEQDAMAAALGWLRAPEYRTEIQDILRPDGTLIDLADILEQRPKA